jgi:hypothetical protein
MPVSLSFDLYEKVLHFTKATSVVLFPTTKFQIPPLSKQNTPLLIASYYTKAPRPPRPPRPRRPAPPSLTLRSAPAHLLHHRVDGISIFHVQLRVDKRKKRRGEQGERRERLCVFGVRACGLWASRKVWYSVRDATA